MRASPYQHDLLHGVPPGLVHHGEAPSLLRHLVHDVRGAEDGLQVQPGGLHLQPLVQDLLQEQQLPLPVPERAQSTALTYGRGVLPRYGLA